MSAAVDGSLLSLRRISANLAVYGLAHALVDAISAGMLFTLWHLKVLSVTETGFCFLFYNLLAFGTQPVLGLVMDRMQRSRGGAMAGCLLMVLATIGFTQRPLLSIVLVGLGNALFHLGAGSICLNLTAGRAAASGIFVAPGAAGLFLGTYLGQNGTFESWPFILLLAILCGVMLVLPTPLIDYRREQAPGPSRWFLTVLLLLLVCIGMRSMVGTGMEFPWKSAMALSVALMVFVVLGKGLGGVLADRLGWGRVAVGALAVAAPLLAFGAGAPTAAIAGMFLFNLPMPVTLVATANLLPGRPAFAFGLTCLALEAGTWPIMLPPGSNREFSNEWIVFAIVFASAVILYLGLQMAFRRLPLRFARVHP